MGGARIQHSRFGNPETGIPKPAPTRIAIPSGTPTLQTFKFQFRPDGFYVFFRCLRIAKTSSVQFWADDLFFLAGT